MVADDQPALTERVVRVVHTRRPELPILIRTRFADGRETLTDPIVAEEETGIAHLVAGVLGRYEVVPEHVRRHAEAGLLDWEGNRAVNDFPSSRIDRHETMPTEPIRLSREQLLTDACTHVDEAGAVTPSADGCEECLKMGDTWVHLRICMTCGHVGCCDSSKNKHASKHARETDHPLVKSFEPGEDWAWCYVDEVML